MATFLKDIGIYGNERRRKLKTLGEIAENASRAIWRWSHFKNWGEGQLRNTSVTMVLGALMVLAEPN